MTPGYRAGLVLLCFLAGAPSVLPAPPERSVSSSRQFLVYGSDVRLRGAICDLAERTKRDVVNLIAQRDEWTTPIVINAQYPQANLPERPRAALSFSQTGFGLKLQLDLTIASDASPSEVRRELLRAILLEIMYRPRSNLAAGTTYVPPPDWLLDGIQPRQSELDEGRLRAVLEAHVTARKILPLAEFLRPRKRSGLDGPDRSLYEAYSFALVELLTLTLDGRGRIARFIADIPSASNDPLANLGTHFPELSDAKSAEKTWSLHIARLAIDQPFQLLSAEETEKKLEELLILRVSGAGPKRQYQVDEFAELMRNASAKVALIQCSRDLSILATRANPIYRPIVYEYAKTVTLLAQGRVKGTAERLARLSETRKSVAVKTREINDYLNWVEASKSPGPSGAFVDYMKAAEMAPPPEQKRRDAISVYLDVLEGQFQD
jgi:hypothetical protein